jgi:hypothetical protein
VHGAAPEQSARRVEERRMRGFGGGSGVSNVSFVSKQHWSAAPTAFIDLQDRIDAPDTT